jgi:hypothetical protein
MIPFAWNTRPAACIVAHLDRLLKIETYCLFTVPPSWVPGAKAHYAFVSTTVDDAILPAGFRWIPTEGLVDDLFAEPADCQAIAKALLQFRSETNQTAKRAFLRPGWLPEIMDWVQGQISPAGLRLTRKFDQLNAVRRLVCFASKPAVRLFGSRL